MKRNLIIHLGAHKTATTYIQDTIFNNNDKLLEHEVYFIQREDFRREVNVPNFYPNTVDKELNYSLEKYLEDNNITAKNIVLSDENIIGLIHEQVDASLYTNSLSRLRKLKDFIGDDFNITGVYFCVRSYDAYFTSLYCESLKGRSFYPFQQLKNEMIKNDFNWQEVVDLICSVFGNDVFKFWTYEDFANNIDFFLQAMSFNTGISFEKPKKVIRKGFSNESIAVLTNIYKNHGEKFITKKVKSTIIAELDNDMSTKFAPFNRLESTTLKRLYHKDISRLEKNYSRLQP